VTNTKAALKSTKRAARPKRVARAVKGKSPKRKSDAASQRKSKRPRASTRQDAVKDENAAHPIATAWRPTLREIVKAFVRGDYALTKQINSVAPVSKSSATQIRGYIADYGETLVELPDETWTTSLAQWMGSFWEILVDLWTAETGRSDMVLHAQVFEAKGGFRIKIHAVYVP
jgi:hypothetical protein